MIPKRIIQTSRSRALQPIERASAAALRSLHPDWDYLFFDDQDISRFIQSTFPQYLEAFNNFPRVIQRIDFFRYLAVLHFGGFYFDLDVLLWRNLDDLRHHPAVFSIEEPTLNRYLRRNHGITWEIGNFAFGACPGNRFLFKVAENCVRAQNEPDWFSPMMAGIPAFFRDDFIVLNSTGPGLLTRTWAENAALRAQTHILFPPQPSDSRSWHQFLDYGVHVMQGSWRTKGSFLKRRLAALWESRERRRVVNLGHTPVPSLTDISNG